MAKYIIGISGASGIILGLKTALGVAKEGHEVELVISDSARVTAQYELHSLLHDDKDIKNWFPKKERGLIRVNDNSDLSAPIGSDTYPVEAMAVVPCSMTSLAAISIGLADTLLRRAADITIKEKRKLVLVPRETPFSLIHLENMVKLAHAGAVIMPPQPAWYTQPTTIVDVESHIVGRILEALGLPTDYSGWN